MLKVFFEPYNTWYSSLLYTFENLNIYKVSKKRRNLMSTENQSQKMIIKNWGYKATNVYIEKIL